MAGLEAHTNELGQSGGAGAAQAEGMEAWCGGEQRGRAKRAKRWILG